MNQTIEEIGAEIRRLHDAKPTTEFERVAESIVMEMESHNGGVHYEVSLFHVLKYPTAFELESMKFVKRNV